MHFTRELSKLILTLTLVLISTKNVLAQSSLMTTLPTPEVAEEKPHKSTGKVTFSIYSRQTEDAFARSHQGVTTISPEFTARYGQYLTLGLDLAGIFGSGNASNFWNDDGKAPNSILLNEAYVKVNVFEGVFIKAGVIKTPLNPVFSIMSPGAFMGTQQEWQIGSDNSNITLSAFQAIPSSGTVSRRIYDDGTQAYYLTQTLGGKLKSEAFGTEFRVAATRFQFENLSNNVAGDSYLSGNSLSAFEGFGKLSRFRHGFMGTEAAFNLKQEIGKHEACVFASTITNDQAPAGKNKGNIVGACLKVAFGNVLVRPTYSVFDYDADVTPAAYTTLTGRYHNREGYRVGIDVELKKEKLALKSYYTKMDVKEANPYLADREIYNLAVEAKYDIF
ncbi:MAG: hypothetical protein JNL11_09345 [Bdellovibrionaceae bacterium]|nr:hypothetical protein [Pseudobdellovibrionaceae bacterium]